MRFKQLENNYHFKYVQALHMVHKSKEAISIIEDMMEEQIISTENADLKTRVMVSSLQLLRGQV